MNPLALVVIVAVLMVASFITGWFVRGNNEKFAEKISDNVVARVIAALAPQPSATRPQSYMQKPGA